MPSTTKKLFRPSREEKNDSNLILHNPPPTEKKNLSWGESVSIELLVRRADKQRLLLFLGNLCVSSHLSSSPFPSTVPCRRTFLPRGRIPRFPSSPGGTAWPPGPAGRSRRRANPCGRRRRPPRRSRGRSSSGRRSQLGGNAKRRDNYWLRHSWVAMGDKQVSGCV